MSWLFSQALVEEFSAGTSLAGEPCAQLNVTPTQHKFWRNDKTMESSDLSRFGLTLRLLTENLGAELLMSFLEASHVKTSARPGAAKELMGNGLVSGVKWHELSMRYDPASSSWKTRHSLFEEDLPWSSVILPNWGMTRDGELLERTAPALHTGESGSGWWQTPTVEDAKRNGSAAAWKEYVETKRTTQCRLRNQAAAADGRNGRLNPDWLEWVMGWIPGWTDLRPLETARFHEWQQQHGKF